jgi:hypothetical protein
MQLDQALQWAVTLSWDDLMQPTAARSIRVEYLCEPGRPLDHLSVWSVNAGGYQDLVCDYWTSTFSAHSAGASFAGRHVSDKLAQILGWIMKNQAQLTRAFDAGRHGLVLIYPPTAQECTEAAANMDALVIN